MNSSKTDKLITAKEVEALTGVDVKTVYEGGCKTDELLRIPLSSRKIVFSFNDVQEWIKRRIAEAQSSHAEKTERKRSLLVQPRFTKQTTMSVLRDFKQRRTAAGE